MLFSVSSAYRKQFQRRSNGRPNGSQSHTIHCSILCIIAHHLCPTRSFCTEPRRSNLVLAYIYFLQVTRSTRVISKFSFMQFTGKQYFWRVYGSVCIGVPMRRHTNSVNKKYSTTQHRTRSLRVRPHIACTHTWDVCSSRLIYVFSCIRLL